MHNEAQRVAQAQKLVDFEEAEYLAQTPRRHRARTFRDATARTAAREARKVANRALVRAEKAARKSERELERLQRQARFHGMTEEAATLARFYSGSAGGGDLTDNLRENR